MKKLMFAAAALTAGFCMADVTSANIVGYGPTALQYGGKFAAGCFVPVSGTMIDLTDLAGTGYGETEGMCDQFINVQTVNEAGSTEATYVWMDSGEGPDGEWYGWYPEGSETKVVKGQVTFQPGEGLWIYSDRAGLFVRSAGQVETANDIIESRIDDLLTGTGD